MFSVPSLIRSCEVLYFIPPFRFNSVAMGMFVGYVIRRPKEVQWETWQLALGHVSAVLCFLFTAVMFHLNRDHSQLGQALYTAGTSITWSWIFAWLILASHFGPKSKFG